MTGLYFGCGVLLATFLSSPSSLELDLLVVPIDTYVVSALHKFDVSTYLGSISMLVQWVVFDMPMRMPAMYDLAPETTLSSWIFGDALGFGVGLAVGFGVELGTGFRRCVEFAEGIAVLFTDIGANILEFGPGVEPHVELADSGADLFGAGVGAVEFTGGVVEFAGIGADVFETGVVFVALTCVDADALETGARLVTLNGTGADVFETGVGVAERTGAVVELVGSGVDVFETGGGVVTLTCSVVKYVGIGAEAFDVGAGADIGESVTFTNFGGETNVGCAVG